ncbi:MAG: hypothetical protein ACR2JE_15510 [Acidobacteriaceae bacterium]
MVTNVTNPIAGGAALVTNSAANGPMAADAATFGAAIKGVASGNGIKNPAEAANSIGGAIDSAKALATTVTSTISGYFVQPPLPAAAPSVPK